MARIVRFKELAPRGKPRIHTEVECGYTVSQEDGEVVLQLDTYGSNEREIPGKVSQSIQLDKHGAEELTRILRQAFPGLR